MAAERVELPGFGLPVNYWPDDWFPTAAMDWSGTILTVRELNMMAIMDKITDKPDWDRKVFDDNIVHKWRQEALAIESMDVSEKMLDYVRMHVLLETLSSTMICQCRLFSLIPFKRPKRLRLCKLSTQCPPLPTSMPTVVFAVIISQHESGMQY